MKKSLLALLFAVALVVPAVAENMWVGGSLGYEKTSPKGGDSDITWSIAPEFGYSLNETWDIGIDLAYASYEGPTLNYKKFFVGNDKVTAIQIAPFARYKMFEIGDFSFLAKGTIFYESAKVDKADASIDSYGIAIAPVVTYTINETWSIGCTLDFAEIGYSHSKGDDKIGDPEVDEFGFNVNDGSIISVNFSYHF